MSSILKPILRKISYVTASFWERIEARLTLLGRNQADLAEHVDITDQAVSAWKSGATQSPKPDHLIAAAEFLKTTEKWLWRGSDRRCDAEGNLMHDRASRLDPDSIAIGEAFQVMPADLKPAFQKVADTFAQSAQLIPWDGTQKRRQGDT